MIACHDLAHGTCRVRTSAADRRGQRREGRLADLYGDAVIEASSKQLAAPAAGGVEGLRVIPEQHRKAVDALAEVMRELEMAQSRWKRRGGVGDVGTDPVSLQLVANMDAMLDRAREYVRVWSTQVRETHDALQAQLAAYESTEQRTADGFRAS